MKKFLISSLVLSIFFLIGCSNSAEVKTEAVKLLSEEEIGYRTSNLYEENVALGSMAIYSGEIAGSSTNIDRSFENAPPLIPHSVEGQFPITIKQNTCIECHAPAVADSLKSTAMPASHFSDYRPKHSLVKGLFIRKTGDNEVSSKSLGDKMYLGRYNCSQCHVPQTDVAVEIQNNFEALFRDLKDNKNSNLNKNMNEGI
ncbi:MAG: nitrate reductase cytochrome c-type subunit; periplasmic nitrate reductase electron transfer subunit [Bacteroidetes bacterium]|jgi:nitrate reductase (cytochrome), electron transfer subunit|nr:nitrate reductase cytochrome c-type subunit; periplasmic nitrate reductase electron transfer subunit [Bacteroidota bacterium]MBT6687838.1 nitrate reductase cytochrome c-type subunit; periplasmic nitrate reductase electron transfer subunit [Bacteroidota bacterium]MBT7142094.1 nitrate reductase cytochrome c-type subunit; periplasmic nitrate reductase electron transfer subunit [Bacteroidota bacterium]MBT7492365.1 nitrate reductase cytochrome c-type subunit; periplasmic nitrate reductase electron